MSDRKETEGLERLAKVEVRYEEINLRLTELRDLLSRYERELEQKIERLNEKVDGIDKKITKFETSYKIVVSIISFLAASITSLIIKIFSK